jgi:hypothetical protein
MLMISLVTRELKHKRKAGLGCLHTHRCCDRCCGRVEWGARFAQARSPKTEILTGKLCRSLLLLPTSTDLLAVALEGQGLNKDSMVEPREFEP